MPLDKDFFNSVKFELHRGKYYEAKAVDDMISQIRSKADAANRENEELKARLAEFEAQKAELSDALISARAIYKGITAKANQDAQEIRDRAAETAARNEEFYIHKMENFYTRLKDSHNKAIDDLNSTWQEFLSTIDVDDSPSEPLYPESEAPEPPTNEPVSNDDIQRLIRKIAEEASEIGNNSK